MIRKLACTVALLLLSAGATAQAVTRAYVGKDGNAHVVFSNARDTIVPPEPNQVGCTEPEIAKDKRTVAWAVLVENCCTSYPVATALVVFRDRKKVVLSTGQMVYEWRFVDGGTRLAVLSGPVHGSAAAAYLYEASNGNLADRWDGRGKAPAWARRWNGEFKGQRDPQ